MKTNTLQNNDVIVSGAKQSGSFSIAANGKAFKILIDGLYSNKIQAIIRELSSNAFDSHAAAKTSDKPFELQLPNLLDPTFMVRDYGTSLSHESVMGLYTTVFQSTKEDSNEGVGKFGLGSKTPFAYTDSFTVTAFLRDTKRVYGAYIDITGIPMISLMASENTSEPDGLMVSFPVNVKDCERFRTEAERVLSGFDVKPIVKGAEVSPTIYESIYEGSNFKIISNRKTGPLARQGCVIYPIDLDALPDLNINQQNILNSNIIIDFPIGQVDITPSRESLSYDDQTIKNILDMAEKIDTEIKINLKEELKKVRVLYEAQVLKDKFLNMDIKSATNFAKTMTWNGLPVKSDYAISRDKLKVSHGVAIDGLDRHYFGERKNLRFNYNTYTSSWEVTANTVFVLETSQSKKAASKIKQLTLDDPDINNVVWIKQADADKPINRKKLLQLIGYAPLLNVDDIVLPEKAKLQRAKPISREQIRIKYVDSLDVRREEVVDLTGKDYLYIFEDGRNYFRTSSSLSINHNTFLKFLKFLSIDKKDVKIISSKQREKVAKFSNWTEVINAKNLAKLKSAVPFAEYYENEQKGELGNHWIKDHINILDMSYDKDTAWKKVLDIIQKVVYDKKNNIDADLMWLYRDVAGYNEFEKATQPHKGRSTDYLTLKDAFANAIIEYPMMKWVTKPGYYDKPEETIKEVENYIKLVDGSKN